MSTLPMQIRCQYTQVACLGKFINCRPIDATASCADDLLYSKAAVIADNLFCPISSLPRPEELDKMQRYSRGQSLRI